MRVVPEAMEVLLRYIISAYLSRDLLPSLVRDGKLIGESRVRGYRALSNESRAIHVSGTRLEEAVPMLSYWSVPH